MKWLSALLVIGVIVGAGWVLTHFTWTTESTIAELEQKPVHENLNDRQQKVIDMLVERNKLTVSLCTLIMGGTVGILATVLKDLPASLPWPAWLTLLLSWISLAGSIFGGYKHYEGLALMLNYKFFEPFETFFVRWSEVQFWLFLVGLLFSLVFLLQIAFSVRGRVASP